MSTTFDQLRKYIDGKLETMDIPKPQLVINGGKYGTPHEISFSQVIFYVYIFSGGNSIPKQNVLTNNLERELGAEVTQFHFNSKEEMDGVLSQVAKHYNLSNQDIQINNATDEYGAKYPEYILFTAVVRRSLYV